MAHTQLRPRIDTDGHGRMLVQFSVDSHALGSLFWTTRNRRLDPVPRIIARLQADWDQRYLHNVHYVRNPDREANQTNPSLVVRGLLAQHLHNFLNTFLISFDTTLSEDLEGDLVTVVRNHPETRILKLSSLELGDIKH